MQKISALFIYKKAFRFFSALLRFDALSLKRDKNE